MPRVDHEDENVVRVTVKRYFFAGFLVLPWLWLYNFLYVFPILKRPGLSKDIPRYAYASLLLSFLFFIGLTTWFVYFLTHRTEMGALGDQLSIVIPKGSA